MTPMQLKPPEGKKNHTGLRTATSLERDSVGKASGSRSLAPAAAKVMGLLSAQQGGLAGRMAPAA